VPRVPNAKERSTRRLLGGRINWWKNYSCSLGWYFS